MSFRKHVENVRDESAALAFLKQKNCIRRVGPNCPTCDGVMTWVKNGVKSGEVWHCRRHRTKVTPRTGSIFSKSRLTNTNLVDLAYSWSNRLSVVTATQVTGLPKQSVIFWYKKFRRICTTWLMDNPYQIGGPGVVVQIDETLTNKAKNNRGVRVHMEKNWAFGGYCPATKQGFLQLVGNDRSAASLEPLIALFIAPGSIIHSDMWGAYNNLTTMAIYPPYQHVRVNHKRHFKDPVTGCHTNHVEGYWNNMKMKFKAMHGTTLKASHIDEFMWREIHGKTPDGNHSGQVTMDRLLQHIAIQHPTP